MSKSFNLISSMLAAGALCACTFPHQVSIYGHSSPEAIFPNIPVAAASSLKTVRADSLSSLAKAMARQMVKSLDATDADYKLIPIVSTSFVSLDNFTKTDSDGRSISEMIVNHFAQDGFKVRDFRVRPRDIVVKNNGEFILSRDNKKVQNAIPESLIMTGTMTRERTDFGFRQIFSARLVRDDGVVLATSVGILERSDLWK